MSVGFILPDMATSTVLVVVGGSNGSSGTRFGKLRSSCTHSVFRLVSTPPEAPLCRQQSDFMLKALAAQMHLLVTF